MDSAEKQLTPRQLEVLELLATGLTNKEIASRLEIAVGTVKLHVSAVTAALGVSNRTEAAGHLHRSGLDRGSKEMDLTRRVPGFGARPMIAVLPFALLAPPDEASWLADGIVDDLVSRLGRWKWFPVISRSSTMRFRDHAMDPREIGRELGARYLVEGTVRASAAELRISARVIDTEDGRLVWSEEFDRPRDEAFAAQDEIIESIVASLSPALLEIGGIRSSEEPVEGREAWAAYERASSHLWEGAAGIDSSILFFEKAIAASPSFLAAYAGLALAEFHLFALGHAIDPENLALRLARLAHRARQIDDANAYAYFVEGLAQMANNRGDAAVSHFERAVEISPNHVWGHALLGSALLLCGRSAEAADAIDVAMRLSPKDPMRYFLLQVKGVTYTTRNRFVDAEPYFRESIEIFPESPHAYILLAGCRVVARDLRGARALGKEMRARDPYFDPEWSVQVVVPEGWRFAARGMLKLIGIGRPLKRSARRD